jgi:protein-S-isoprenylcysteine O-methyltransferase Ste14
MSWQLTLEKQDLSAPAVAPPKLAPRSAAAALDWVERLMVIGLYGWLVARLVISYSDRAFLVNSLLLTSEGLVVFFILIRRRSTGISRNPLEWLMAFFATSMPLLVNPNAAAVVHPWSGAAAVLGLLAGILFQVSAKISLGRSFGLVPAHRGLKLSGPYRLVRHPMYAGYLLTHLAFLVINPTPWNFLVYGICYSLQVPRLLAEERFLSSDPSYCDYISRVRYRLLPGVF